MKGWIATIVAGITAVVALTIDPTAFFGSDTQSIKFIVTVMLVSAALFAFFLGREASELSLSRHVSAWVCGFALIAIIAANMDVLTGTAKSVVVKPKPQNKAVVLKPRKIKPSAAEVYVPDTPKINRVERIVEIDPLEQLKFSQNDEPIVVKNFLSKKDSVLPEKWPLSEKEKKNFKRFLARQGLKFDPETAFAMPQKPATRSPYSQSPVRSTKSDSRGTSRPQ